MGFIHLGGLGQNAHSRSTGTSNASNRLLLEDHLNSRIKFSSMSDTKARTLTTIMTSHHQPCTCYLLWVRDSEPAKPGEAAGQTMVHVKSLPNLQVFDSALCSLGAYNKIIMQERQGQMTRTPPSPNLSQAPLSPLLDETLAC